MSFSYQSLLFLYYIDPSSPFFFLLPTHCGQKRKQHSTVPPAAYERCSFLLFHLSCQLWQSLDKVSKLFKISKNLKESQDFDAQCRGVAFNVILLWNEIFFFRSLSFH